MQKKLEAIAITVLVSTSLVIATLIVRREFFGPATTNGRSIRAAAAVQGWEKGREVGRLIGGSAQAPHSMIVFVDLECPACAAFSSTVDSLQERFPDSLAVYYVHAPAQYHRFALPAARAAECAASFGAFKSWTHAVYAHQDSLGLRSWAGFARAANIVDTAHIARCALSGDTIARIEDGIALSKKLGVRRLPTVVLDGLMYDGAPSIASVDSVIRPP